MGAPHLGEDFLEVLEKSELVERERVATAVERLGLRGDAAAADVAKALVRAGLITRFQASRLLKGMYRGFYIGQYKVLEILGAGGMGLLYTAEDTHNQQTVALKVLFEAHREDASMLARFEAEGRAGLKIAHPNIVRTYKLGRDEGVYFIVMEYVRGISLQEFIARYGKLDWKQACDVVCQVAAGLHHLHLAGLVHRDVKPHNLIISADGECKLLDFGLTMLSGDRDDLSLAMIFGHDCLGTADYVAPEQTLDSNAVDGRADIYSLGCTLYQCITGEPPFPGKSISRKLRDHRQTPAPRLANVPRELADVVARMMAKKPQERYQSGTEVCRALAPFALRGRFEFDFNAVLAARIVEANQRMAAIRKQQQDQSTSPSKVKSLETTIPLEVVSSHVRVRTPGLVDASASTPLASGLEIKHAETGRVLLRWDAPTLVDARLSGVSLAGAQLAGQDLRRLCFPNGDFAGANLQGANLYNARLARSYFGGANLRYADLTGAELTDANLGKSDLAGAKLIKADLHHARLTGANLQGAELTGADLRMADLQCDLSNANLSYCDLRGANLTRANLEGANLEYANLTGANIAGANLAGARLSHALDPYGNAFPTPKPQEKSPDRSWWKFWAKG